MKNKYTLKKHLTLVLILFSLSITLITAVSFNYFLSLNFSKYTAKQQMENIETLINMIEISSPPEQIQKFAKQSEIELSDTLSFEKRKGKNVLPIKVDDNKTLYIYFAKAQLKNKEVDLKNSINSSLLLIELFVFIGSLIIGSLVSKKISKPIKKITDDTLKIKDGDFDISEVDNNIHELKVLSKSIKEMARQIELNIEHDKRFNQDIQHELRTPLTNLYSQIEAMVDKIYLPSDENLNFCLKEIERMSDILSQIQTLDRLENSIDKVSLSEFDISLLVNEIKREFELRTVERNQKIINEIDDNIIIKADVDKIKSALINLISNAIRYSGENTNITVSYSCNDNFHILSVSDNGKGLDPNDLVHIKERFFRVDKSRSREFGGSGLGLSIVEAIASVHRGKLEVKSEKNKKTTFSIFLEKKI